MSRLFLCLILCAIPAYGAEATSQPATSQPANDFERVAQQTVDILDSATAALAPVKDEATAREAATKLTALKKDVDDMKVNVAKLGQPSDEVQAAAMSKYAKRIEGSYLRLAAEQMRMESDPKLDAIVGKPLNELGLIRAAATSATTTTAPAP
jgi:hypothetical protein